jgi:hypothetical protein
MGGVTAMDNAETHDLVTVLSRLEGLKGMAHEIGRQSTDDLGVAATDAERTGLLRKMLASIRSWLIVPGK